MTVPTAEEIPLPAQTLADVIGEFDTELEASSLLTPPDNDQNASDEWDESEAIESEEAPAAFTIAEVIAFARSHHPRAIASQRSIDQAESNVHAAAVRENPEFVLDVDTPVHDADDATELSTRLTFPIGQSQRRSIRIRVARAEVATAIATYQAILRRVSDDATSAAIRLSYLEQRAEIDERVYRIAIERFGLLSPELREGDAAANLVDSVDAAVDTQQAAGDHFESQRELLLARVALAAAMGLDPETESELAETLSVEPMLDVVPFALPPLQDVIAAALEDSAELAAVSWATQKGWIEHESAGQPRLAMEAGPRYQDRLGRNDDTVGVRFQSDVPIYSAQNARIAVAGIKAQILEDQVQLKRHEIAAAAAHNYHELESIARQLEFEASDRFIKDQEEILRDELARSLLTGQQMLRIQRAILKQQRDQLELRYRFAVLRSQLRLHTFEAEIEYE